MGHSGRIRVMIVDDHRMVREGLKTFLSTSEDLEVVGEAADGAEAVGLAPRLKPDVVLMDVMMPTMDGATATSLILDACPGTQVIALTSFTEEDLVQRTLDAGAISYLLKDAQADRLVAAIRDAARGRGTIDGQAMKAIVQRDRVGGDLTPREREVLALLAAGLSNNEIAGRLYLSPGTVRLHVSNILAKLGAPNRTAAAIIAVKHGLAEAP